MWDRTKGRIVKPAALLPPHEVFDACIPMGEEHRWTSFGPGQEGVHDDLMEWASRVHVADTSTMPWLCLQLWGRCSTICEEELH